MTYGTNAAAMNFYNLLYKHFGQGFMADVAGGIVFKAPYGGEMRCVTVARDFGENDFEAALSALRGDKPDERPIAAAPDKAKPKTRPPRKRKGS